MRRRDATLLAALLLVGSAFAAWWLLRDPGGVAPVGLDGRDAIAPATSGGDRPEAGAVKREGFVDVGADPESAGADPAAASRAVALGALTVRVTDELGTPLSGAEVEILPGRVVATFADQDFTVAIEALVAEPPAPVATAKTDRDGVATFAPRAGAWSARASAPGRTTAASPGFRVGPDLADPRVVLRLAPARVVSGRVVDDADAPVAGARIAWIDDRYYQRAEPARRERTTDAEGRFRLDDVAEGAFSLAVRAAGRALLVKRFESAPDGETTIRLERAARIRGTARDAATKAPLPDVEILAAAWGEELRAARTKTDADGAFVIAEAPTGKTMLVARKAGYALLVPPPESPEDMENGWWGDGAKPIGDLRPGADVVVELVLSGGCEISGVVVDADTGAGVAGAEVRLRSRSFGIGGRRNEAATTDEGGRFRIANAAAGDFLATASKRGWFVEDPTPPEAEEAGEASPSYSGVDDVHAGRGGRAEAGQRVADLTIRLRRGAKLSGVVVDEAGAPVRRAKVRWRPAENFDPYGEGASDGAEEVSDAEGRFAFEGVPPRALVLRATHPEFPAGAFLAYDASEAGRAPAKLVLSRGGVVAGRVTYPDGSPGAGIALLFVPGDALRRNDVEPGAEESTTTADADGRFRFEGLPLGKGVLGPHWSNYARFRERARAEGESEEAVERATYLIAPEDARVVVAAGAEPVKVRLVKPLEIEGVVVDAEGAPLAGATVMAEAEGLPDSDAEDDPFLPRVSGAQTDEAGRFAITGVAAIKYALTVSWAAPEPEPKPEGETPTPEQPKPADAPPEENVAPRKPTFLSANVPGVPGGRRGMRVVAQ
jgi:protocatechuate 3,4-dioxygenase beta subunit